MPDGIDPSLFGLGAGYQIWSGCQARSRVSGAQAGFTTTEYLIYSAQPNRDVSRAFYHTIHYIVCLCLFPMFIFPCISLGGKIYRSGTVKFTDPVR